MAKLGLNDAKKRLSELVDRVAQGERITITRQGVPVAVLVPIDEDEVVSVAEAARRLRKIRELVTPDDVTIRQLRDEGRRS